MGALPGDQHPHHVGNRRLLHLPARRHVEQPPAHPLETALHARPGLEPHRVEAVGRNELDGEAHAGRHVDHVVGPLLLPASGLPGWRAGLHAATVVLVACAVNASHRNVANAPCGHWLDGVPSDAWSASASSS